MYNHRKSSLDPKTGKISLKDSNFHKQKGEPFRHFQIPLVPAYTACGFVYKNAKCR